MIRALRPMIVKEFRQIRRDPTSLGMLLFLPAAIIVLVGYTLNFDVKHIPLAVYDQSGTPQSRDFLQTFKQTEYFDLMFAATSDEGIEELFRHNRAKVAIVIPPTFATELGAGKATHVQILVDGADNTTAGQAVAYSAGLTTTYSARLVAQAMMRRGVQQYEPIDFRPRVWYNPNLLSSSFLVPGLIGFIIVLTCVVSTSLTVVREKERGTMEQIMVSPLRPVEVILGKLIPYMLIGLIAATVVIVLGYILFGVHVAGSLSLLYGALFILIVGALGQGLLISTITDSQQVAFMISIFSSLLPSFLLSGFVFPISNMPIVLQIASNVAVNKFFLVIVRGIMLKGVGFLQLWDQFVYMSIFALVMIGISSKRMQKRTL